MKEKWVIRGPRKDDLAFIYSTWMTSYLGDSLLAKPVRASVFKREYVKVIDNLLDTCGVLVACQPDDERVIYGYLVFSPAVLHYCFVKEAFRFFGIAKDLVKKAVGIQPIQFYTHHTGQLKPIVEKYPLLTYNPFILFKEVAK